MLQLLPLHLLFLLKEILQPAFAYFNHGDVVKYIHVTGIFYIEQSAFKLNGLLRIHFVLTKIQSFNYGFITVRLNF